MSYTTYLAHHGIKGQKWGIRRYQNEDGSLTAAGKQRSRLRRRIISRDKTNPEINDLVRAMSDEDKARIGLDKGQEYTNHDESVNIAHRSVLRRGKKIVAFCDAFMAEADLGQYGKNPLYVAIGTSAEQQNRGKGYATIVAKQMQKWFNSQDEFDVVVWSAKKDNVASRKIAEKLNFKYIPESASDTWVDYAYSKKREVRHSVIVNDDICSYRSYLAHHGIKGQKWGVRRFQKADGSLTAAGAKRYGIGRVKDAGRKVGSGIVKGAKAAVQKAKEVKARKAAEKLERQKKVWAKTRLGLTMNADKFTIEELREANNRLDERDRAAIGLAEQVKRGVGYFQAIRDVTGAIKDTKDYIEDISGEKGKKAKAADELKYQRELEKEKRTYERDMVRDKVKADQEYEYKREKDRLDRESKEKIEKMKAKAKKKKESGGSDPEPEPDDAPKKKKPSENTTEFEDVYWNSSKKDREFMETVFPKEVDEAIERKNRRNKARRERNKARREVDEAIRRMGFFGHSDISIYGAYLEHHGIKGQKWGVRRFQNEDGTLTKAGMKRAGYKFKTLRKNATASRILIDENEDTSNLDRAYFSTNNLDNQKWANYFASIGAQYLDKSAYSINFKTKKKLIIARGEEISKVASKLMDKDDTFRKEFEATKQKQIQSTGSEEAWESLSESAKYSAMIAYKCEGGKKIISAMKDIGFDGVEDLFGKDVSKDPIIIFNPGSNLRQVGQKQELKGLYRGYRKYYGLPINHSSFSCNNISNNAGGSNQMFMNDDLLAYGAYLEHHGIKGQKWGVRRYQNEDGSLTTAGLKRQARRYTKELNKNDKALAVSRAHGIMARNELSNLDARVDRLRKAGKHEKAEKVLAKQQKRRAKLKDAKEMWDEKTLKTYERQFEIADACKKLKIDVTAKDTYRSTRTRGEKIANFAINVLAASLGVHRISRSEIQGTKYKAKYKEAEHTVDNNVTNYGKGGTIRKQYSTSYEDGDGSRRRNRRTSTSRYN